MNNVISIESIKHCECGRKTYQPHGICAKCLWDDCVMSIDLHTYAVQGYLMAIRNRHEDMVPEIARELELAAQSAFNAKLLSDDLATEDHLNARVSA